MSRKLPPLNALRAFEAAARCCSFKLAAEELNVSQSAISHQVKHLEDYLQTTLFHRRTRAVELTPAGQKFFPFLQEAFDHMAEGTRLLARLDRDDVLTIQTYSTFAVRWLMLRLAKFEEKHADITVRLTTSQWNVDFSEQDTDVAIMIGEPQDGKINFDYLFSPRMFPVCSPALLEQAGGLGSPADLANRTILQVYPSEDDWKNWLAATGTEGIDPNSGTSFDSYDHALKMAVRGLGVALAMQPYVGEDLSAGLLVSAFPELEVPAPGKWYLVYPESRGRIRKIRQFREWLLGEIRDDPDLAPLIETTPARLNA
ncbi:MAG: transcriptional regulator GcvA [Alphaproteobacteria bacterium]|nr:MAG: transcriptional regulator GcvA [Alphaproteobacteria bacterium]